jgi:asparagine synthase (glutamine-hydrolysing)
MKAIYPYLDRVVPHSRIEHFFRNPFDYEHTEECSISGIRRVLSGHYGQWKSGKLKLTRWWNTLDHLVTVPNSYSDQVDCFREIFLDAVRIRMRSDVPIGTALSGGLDSSAVFCAMYHLISNGKFESSNAPQAFTAHYPNSDLDETKWAKFVTEYLNVPLNQVTIDPTTSAWNLIDSIKQVEDPYITLPIPMLSTYQAIKKSGITVTLDGHGADELFSGYNDIYLNMISSSVDRTSELLAISKSLSSGNYHLNDSKLNLYWNKFLSLTKYVGKKSRSFLWKDYANRYSDFHRLEYKKMSLFDRRLYEIFHVTILPTLLRNYDRYSMANGVEVRMPFMDYRLVTYCFSLPVESKLGGGYTKRILRDAMRGIVPNEILDRRDKVGWNAPLHEWLCGPLSNEIDMLVSSSTNIRPTLRSDWKRFKENTQRSFQDGQKIWAELQPKIWLDICDSIK